MCKSKRGLTRHKNTKRAQQTIPQPTNSTSEAITSEETILKKLHPLHLKKMVEKCAIKFSEDLCLPEEERVKFTSQNFTFTTDDSVQLWNHFKPLILEYTGDAEKCYSVFHGLLCDNLLATKF